MKIKINDDLLGEIKNNLFIKCVEKEKHFFKKGNAYGIDLECFEKYAVKNCSFIIIKELDTKKQYFIDIKDFQEHAFYLHFKPHRKQIFCNLIHFSTKH